MNERLARVWRPTVYLLGLKVLCTIVVMFTLFQPGAEPGGEGGSPTATAFETIAEVSGVVYLLAFVFYLIASSRLYQTLALMFHAHNGNFIYTPRQAFWANWIPIINLIRPWYVVSAILVYLENTNATPEKQRRLHPSVTTLLLLLLTSVLLSRTFAGTPARDLGALISSGIDLLYFYFLFGVLQRIQMLHSRIEWQNGAPQDIAPLSPTSGSRGE
jgi:hypothetical protein